MNDNDERARARAETINDEAALWFARMDAENAASHRPEFDTWLATSPDHREAYDRVARINRQFLLVGSIPDYGPNRGQKHDETNRRQAPRGRPFWGSRAALAASLILGLAFGTTIYRQQLMDQRAQEGSAARLMLMTQLGEIRQFRLADGSLLTLDTQSRAEVTITSHERSIHVLAGRARLKVVKDAEPFEVKAGAAMISAFQGLFDVAVATDQQVMLHQITGTAELRQIGSTIWPTATRSIDAGQSLFLGPDQSKPIIPAPADGPVDTADWPSGWVDCRQITLSALLDLAGHYTRQSIVLAQPESGQIEVTGRFRIADTDRFVRNIADQYSLTVTENAQTIHLRPK